MLVLGKVAGDRSERGGWFAPSEVSRLLEALRLPRANVSEALSKLRKGELVVRRTAGSCALTAVGRENVREIFGEIDHGALALVGDPGAEFDNVPHSMLDPAFAPIRWQPGIARLLDRYPFESNVFCMTRFPGADPEGGRPIPFVA